MRSFADRVVLITGAASGIGRQLTVDLIAEGAAVAGIDWAPEALAKLETEMTGKPFASAVADVTDRQALSAAVRQLESRLGPTDLLIASAGIGIENSALEFRAHDFEAQIRVNLVGVANSVEAVLGGMMERRRGHLVAISSLASYRGIPRMAGYCASKAGVNALLEALRVELRPLDIAVTTICPGWIRTPLTADIGVPAEAMLNLPVAARRMLDAIRRRRRYYAFPARGLRPMQLLKWLPAGLSDWLTAQAVRRLFQKKH
jgi:NADP-dependent 3-hydroxy acid dehydrogenase YdfG